MVRTCNRNIHCKNRIQIKSFVDMCFVIRMNTTPQTQDTRLCSATEVSMKDDSHNTTHIFPLSTPTRFGLDNPSSG
jgi:hypothetical protein